MSFKRCHLLFLYILLHKKLSYVLTKAVLEQVAKKPSSGFKEEPKN